MVADVDGDGKADFGVYGYDPKLGYRFDFLLSSKSFNTGQPIVFNNDGYGYGNAQAIPVVADFDGSGKAGFGLYIPSASGSTFYYISPSSGVSFSRSIGGPNDVPSAVDYDGDGKADLSLYGPDPAKPGHYRYPVLTSGSGYDPGQGGLLRQRRLRLRQLLVGAGDGRLRGDRPGRLRRLLPGRQGGDAVHLPDRADRRRPVVRLRHGDDLPLTAPLYRLAKKVRGY